MKSPLSLDDADQLITQRILLAAGIQFPDLYEIPFKLSAAVQKDANGMEFHIEILIDSEGLNFVGIGNQRSYKAVAAVIRASSNGNLIGMNMWTIADQLSNEGYQHIKETGIPFSATIPLTAPSQNLVVVLYDENSDRIASRLVQIKKYKVQKPVALK